MSKIRNFASIIEPEATKQIEETASLDFVKAIAVMPDVHFGKGSTVGSVVVTKGAIMPACVGVDIGCGMIAVRTTLKPEQVTPHLKNIREGLERRIPVGIGGAGQNSKISIAAQNRIETLESMAIENWNDKNYMDRRHANWREQLGSLGGGNHFIEICIGQALAPVISGPDHAEDGPEFRDAPEEVWVILHSGSRGVGNKTGVFWTKRAQANAKAYLPKGSLPNPDLAWLVEGSDDFDQYMDELQWCQEYARLNREEMMDRVLQELYYSILDCGFIGGPLSMVKERINCHHNFVKREHYGGENVWVTRKGAIEARAGSRALIPGSMGARSYIVTGLGNEDSFNSAPHGAGRKMSRTQARKQFDMQQLATVMDGIEARLRDNILDEHPGAYKDIDRVMFDSILLIKPTHVLRQILNVKGD